MVNYRIVFFICGVGDVPLAAVAFVVFVCVIFICVEFQFATIVLLATLFC